MFKRMHGAPPPCDNAPSPAGSSGNKYAPVPWTEYFDVRHNVCVGEETFSVYECVPQIEHSETCFVMLHGAGFSGLSFAAIARKLREKGHRVLSLELRGHGHTRTTHCDLSTSQLLQDIRQALTRLFFQPTSHAQCVKAIEGAPCQGYGSSAQSQDIFLMGHSLGGALATRLGCDKSYFGTDCSLRVVGIVVLDMVEGVAMDGLPRMHEILSNRPKSFPSLEKAIEWSVRSKHIRNLESAAVSMPAQLDVGSDGKYHWRVDLKASSPYWDGWFRGASNDFLGTLAPKLLVLGGHYVLDDTLIVGQMQGKFMLKIVGTAGHVVHEDCPDDTLKIVSDFYIRWTTPLSLPKASSSSLSSSK